jgi:hypothetical protein
MLWLFLKHRQHITLNDGEGKCIDIVSGVDGDDVDGSLFKGCSGGSGAGVSGTGGIRYNRHQ